MNYVNLGYIIYIILCYPQVVENQFNMKELVIYKVDFLTPSQDDLESFNTNHEIDFATAECTTIFKSDKVEECVSFALQLHNISNTPHVVMVLIDNLSTVACKLFKFSE